MLAKQHECTTEAGKADPDWAEALLGPSVQVLHKALLNLELEISSLKLNMELKELTLRHDL